jgi:hypothetical protein
MKRLVLLPFLVLTLSLIAFSHDKSKNETLFEKKREIINVDFCDLFENSSIYNNKIVRVTGIYRFGFEWSDFYCPGCEKVAWMDFEKYDKKQTKKKYRKKIKYSEVGRTVKVVVIGEFSSGGGFGHMGGYRNKFAVHYFEKVEKVSNSSSIYQYLPEKDKAKANCITESQKK